MLRTETVDPTTLELIKELQAKPYLNDFFLVGGTALSLYFGHRKSIDIDLFVNKPFDALDLLEKIQDDFSYQLYFTAISTLKGSIREVNVDLISHRYPLLKPPLCVDGISLLSVADIIAMKLNAISISGQRSKDFIDIYFALEHFAIVDMLSFYKNKYSQSGDMHVLKSLVYFDDVNLSDCPLLLQKQNLKWNDVKKRIEKAVFGFINEIK